MKLFAIYTPMDSQSRKTLSYPKKVIHFLDEILGVISNQKSRFDWKFNWSLELVLDFHRQSISSCIETVSTLQLYNVYQMKCKLRLEVQLWFFSRNSEIKPSLIINNQKRMSAVFLFGFVQFEFRANICDQEKNKNISTENNWTHRKTNVIFKPCWSTNQTYRRRLDNSNSTNNFILRLMTSKHVFKCRENLKCKCKQEKRINHRYNIHFMDVLHLKQSISEDFLSVIQFTFLSVCLDFFPSDRMKCQLLLIDEFLQPNQKWQ